MSIISSFRALTNRSALYADIKKIPKEYDLRHAKFSYSTSPMPKLHFRLARSLHLHGERIRDLLAKHPLDLSMERRARSVYCVRVRMQICKFVVKHKRAPGCRSSAWDVVRQKAVKRRGPLIVPGPPARSLARKPAHARARARTRTSFRVRSLRLFASVRSSLLRAPNAARSQASP